MSCGSFITRRLLLGGSAIAVFLSSESLSAATAPPPKRKAEQPRRLVMLDPGHGGKDPGAIGYSGTYEKHVALAAALELKRQLEASGHYRVELTRRRDVFVPLDGRVAQAEAGRRAVHLNARRCGCESRGPGR